MACRNKCSRIPICPNMCQKIPKCCPKECNTNIKARCDNPRSCSTDDFIILKINPCGNQQNFRCIGGNCYESCFDNSIDMISISCLPDDTKIVLTYQPYCNQNKLDCVSRSLGSYDQGCGNFTYFSCNNSILIGPNHVGRACWDYTETPARDNNNPFECTEMFGDLKFNNLTSPIIHVAPN